MDQHPFTREYYKVLAPVQSNVKTLLRPSVPLQPLRGIVQHPPAILGRQFAQLLVIASPIAIGDASKCDYICFFWEILFRASKAEPLMENGWPCASFLACMNLFLKISSFRSPSKLSVNSAQPLFDIGFSSKPLTTLSLQEPISYTEKTEEPVYSLYVDIVWPGS